MDIFFNSNSWNLSNYSISFSVSFELIAINIIDNLKNINHILFVKYFLVFTTWAPFPDMDYF